MKHKTINSVYPPGKNFTDLAYPNLDNALSKCGKKVWKKIYLHKYARVLFSGKKKEKNAKKGITTKPLQNF